MCEVCVLSIRLGQQKTAIRSFSVFCQHVVEQIRVAHGQIRSGKIWASRQIRPPDKTIQEKRSEYGFRPENMAMRLFRFTLRPAFCLPDHGQWGQEVITGGWNDQVIWFKGTQKANSMPYPCLQRPIDIYRSHIQPTYSCPEAREHRSQLRWMNHFAKPQFQETIGFPLVYKGFSTLGFSTCTGEPKGALFWLPKHPPSRNAVRLEGANSTLPFPKPREGRAKSSHRSGAADGWPMVSSRAHSEWPQKSLFGFPRLVMVAQRCLFRVIAFYFWVPKKKFWYLFGQSTQEMRSTLIYKLPLFWKSCHLEVTSDSCCFLMNDSILFIFANIIVAFL